MDWTKVLLETASVSYSTIIKMIFIVIPLLIAIECLKDLGLMDRISEKLSGVTKLLKLPGEASIGLIVGFLVGLLFGSGVIMQINEEVKMSRYQLNVFFILIGICHAIIEETILFTAIGANGAVVLLSRFVSAVIFTYAFIQITARIAGIRREKASSLKAGE